MHYSPFLIDMDGNIENKFFGTDLKNEGMYNVYCTYIHLKSKIKVHHNQTPAQIRVQIGNKVEVNCFIAS